MSGQSKSVLTTVKPGGSTQPGQEGYTDGLYYVKGSTGPLGITWRGPFQTLAQGEADAQTWLNQCYLASVGFSVFSTVDVGIRRWNKSANRWAFFIESSFNVPTSLPVPVTSPEYLPPVKAAEYAWPYLDPTDRTFKRAYPTTQEQHGPLTGFDYVVKLFSTRLPEFTKNIFDPNGMPVYGCYGRLDYPQIYQPGSRQLETISSIPDNTLAAFFTVDLSQQPEDYTLVGVNAEYVQCQHYGRFVWTPDAWTPVVLQDFQRTDFFTNDQRGKVGTFPQDINPDGTPTVYNDGNGEGKSRQDKNPLIAANSWQNITCPDFIGAGDPQGAGTPYAGQFCLDNQFSRLQIIYRYRAVYEANDGTEGQFYSDWEQDANAFGLCNMLNPPYAILCKLTSTYSDMGFTYSTTLPGCLKNLVGMTGGTQPASIPSSSTPSNEGGQNDVTVFKKFDSDGADLLKDVKLGTCHIPDSYNQYGNTSVVGHGYLFPTSDYSPVDTSGRDNAANTYNLGDTGIVHVHSNGQNVNASISALFVPQFIDADKYPNGATWQNWDNTVCHFPPDTSLESQYSQGTDHYPYGAFGDSNSSGTSSLISSYYVDLQLPYIVIPVTDDAGVGDGRATFLGVAGSAEDNSPECGNEAAPARTGYYAGNVPIWIMPSDGTTPAVDNVYPIDNPLEQLIIGPLKGSGATQQLGGYTVWTELGFQRTMPIFLVVAFSNYVGGFVGAIPAGYAVVGFDSVDTIQGKVDVTKLAEDDPLLKASIEKVLDAIQLVQDFAKIAVFYRDNPGQAYPTQQDADSLDLVAEIKLQNFKGMYLAEAVTVWICSDDGPVYDTDTMGGLHFAPDQPVIGIGEDADGDTNGYLGVLNINGVPTKVYDRPQRKP